MLDPQVKASVSIWAKEEKTEKSAIDQHLRTGLDEKVKKRSGEMKEYHVRPESVQARSIAGKQGLTGVADYLEGERKITEYLIWIRSENTNSLFSASRRSFRTG